MLYTWPSCPGNTERSSARTTLSSGAGDAHYLLLPPASIARVSISFYPSFPVKIVHSLLSASHAKKGGQYSQHCTHHTHAYTARLTIIPPISVYMPCPALCVAPRPCCPLLVGANMSHLTGIFNPRSSDDRPENHSAIKDTPAVHSSHGPTAPY